MPVRKFHHAARIEYGDIFDQRGQLYHEAMRSYPECRSQEFMSVIAMADIKAGMTVVDVPSGGAYLADYLDGARFIGLETSRAFAELARDRTDSVLIVENGQFPLQRHEQTGQVRQKRDRLMLQSPCLTGNRASERT
mgnify:CR=1 FL=1